MESLTIGKKTTLCLLLNSLFTVVLIVLEMDLISFLTIDYRINAGIFQPPELSRGTQYYHFYSKKVSSLIELSYDSIIFRTYAELDLLWIVLYFLSPILILSSIVSLGSIIINYYKEYKRFTKFTLLMNTFLFIFQWILLLFASYMDTFSSPHTTGSKLILPNFLAFTLTIIGLTANISCAFFDEILLFIEKNRSKPFTS
ncbi:MAG: hypothetical protein ACFE95_01615 [Candidatus Hodarchaeota archaeon]